MKKKLAAMIAGAIALVGFAGCADTDEIIGAVSYPTAYFIEYDVTNEDETVTTVAKGVDGAGNYYYKDESGEYIFLVEKGVYTKYAKTEGVWTNTNERITAKGVETQTKQFASYAEKSREKFNGSFKESDASVVLDRACTDYTLTLNLLLYKQNYTFAVDDETGICMEFWGTSVVAGKETQKTGFECVLFQTENIDFSSHITP